MTDYAWPDDIVPYAVSFWLQPHTGGTESPFSRSTKVYGLAAPRWICSFSVRGGNSVTWGRRGAALWGQRMDALLVKMKGRQNRIALHDFRRPAMSSNRWPSGASNLAAAQGATSITITGLLPGTQIYNGDYIGGDGRPHIIASDDLSAIHTTANTSGQAVVTFEPPLASAVGIGAAVFGNPTGLFRLVSDDAGSNPSEVGQLTPYQLDFVEDI